MLNRIVSESFGGRTVNYAYNTAGRTQTTVYPDSTIITKLFDVRNRLTSISKNGNIVVSYAYNNANQVITQTLANGVITNMQYDANNRLINYTTANGGIQNTNISYDNEMNKTALTRVNTPTKSEQFVYDNGHRLTGYKKGIAGSPLLQNTYTYDALGNRTAANLNGTATTYTTNNLNQLLNSNGGSQNINYTYDVRGNLTYDGSFYKKYDAEGRLQKDSSAPTNVLGYLYDAFGRRVQKNFNGNLLKYTFSGLSQIEERDAAGIIKNKTIFSNFMMPVSNEKNGANYYYHQNELNSVEAITNSNGNAVEKYDYDVYGKQTRYDSIGNILPTSPSGNLFGFTGQQYDSSTASNKFLFREYNPSTGTFNERDLIGYTDGMGMYQYVGNNPANGIDIFGLEGTENPCYHDKNKIRLISGRMTFLETQIATKAGNDNKYETDFGGSHTGFGGYLKSMIGVGNWSTGASWITYGRTADSQFYGDTYNSTEANNEFYFMGESLKSWEVNYFFTNSALRNADFSQFTSGGLTNTWNTGKALGSGLKNLSYSAYKDRMNEGIKKSRLVDKAFENNPKNLIWLKKENDFEQNEFGQFWPVINPKTGEIGREFFRNKDMTKTKLERFKEWAKANCPQNPPGPNGTRRLPHGPGDNNPGGSTEVLQSYDPNAILGPDGVTAKKWVSVHDVLPYTILYENDKTATAPAKYVKVIYPIDAKQDAATFSLGSFGFNNLTFSIPPNTAAYSQRLDARDSLGLFVDITAGYDVTNNKAFWEFQSIDPLTLLPPSNPNKGFLLLQDTTKPNNGHAFVNFSIKPKQTDITLDTIHAEAKIVFDGNDTIPTNYIRNTVDAFAPTSHMNTLPATSPNPLQLSWTGTDDAGGSGVKSYTLYVSTNGVSFYILKAGMQRLDTSIALAKDSSYCFFVLATDSVGNMETLRQNEIKCSLVSGAALPVSWLYFRGSNKGKDNLLEWATSNEQNSKEFVLERSLTGVNFKDIAKILSQGNSNTSQNYNYKDVGIDKLNSAVMYYRIKQIDINGNFKYSNIVRLNYNIKEKLNSIVYPNPTQGMITVTVGENSLIGTVAVVMDVNGRILQQIKIAAQSQSIDLKNFSNGTYFIRLQNKEVLRIIKQ